MEFGRVTANELDHINFTLPADAPETDRVINFGKRQGDLKIFVGCAKWGRKDWIGKIYPQGTKESDFLTLYAQHFNCIELNATFYRIPTIAQTSNWKSKVNKDFKFCPKITDQISHIKRLRDTKTLVNQFLTGISGFGENLGPVFLMPHPGMGRKTLDVLENFIQSIPKDIKLYVELRHPEWYSDPEAFQSVFNMMERNQTGSIITDASGRRDCVHMRLTIPEAFIRFVGNGLHPTDYTRVDEWVLRIKSWIEKGIQTIYFFMHQHEEIHSPELCLYVIRQLNKYCGTAIPEPQFIEAGNEILEKSTKKRAARPNL